MLRPKRLQDLLFVDVETTGLDDTKHEVIEVAAIRTSADGETVKSTFEAKLKPLNIKVAEPRALEINGYSEAEWSDDKCKERSFVVDQLQRMAAADGGTVLVGQNVSFDEGFLTPLFTAFGMKAPWGYHKVDTVALAWPLFVSTPLEGLSLGKLCAFLGVEQQPTHRALADAMACREVYLKLMKRYLTAGSPV